MIAAGVGLSGNGRRIALLFIVAFHVLAVWFLPSPSTSRGGPKKPSESREIAISFVTPVPPARKPVNVAHTPARPAARAPKRIPSEPALTFIPAPSEPEPAPAAVEPVVPEKTAADILQQAKSDIGKVDRDLRNASPNMALRKIELHPTKLESGIAGAFKERGPQRIEEIIGPDGRRITKVGNMCAFKESNGLVGGRDVFKDGVKTRWQSCPK